MLSTGFGVGRSQKQGTVIAWPNSVWVLNVTMFLSRWLRPESTAAKWLGIWLVLCCLKASHGLSLQSTFPKTVTKARCTANCFTLVSKSVDLE